jgi:hypothetical protein
MLDGSFDVVPAVRGLAVELDVLRRRVRLLEDAVAALSKPAVDAGGEPAGRKGGKREKAVSDDAADAG